MQGNYTLSAYIPRELAFVLKYFNAELNATAQRQPQVPYQGCPQ